MMKVQKGKQTNIRGCLKMLNEKIKVLLNQQINKELFSAYQYLDFSRLMCEWGYSGFANWYGVQAMEEVDHAVRFFDYLNKENALVELDDIKKPNTKAKDIGEVLLSGLSHEKYITSSINDIYAVASSVGDYRTMRFLDWFIDEQEEEEENAMELIQKYNMVSGNYAGLYILDEELGKRQ